MSRALLKADWFMIVMKAVMLLGFLLLLFGLKWALS